MSRPIDPTTLRFGDDRPFWACMCHSADGPCESQGVVDMSTCLLRGLGEAQGSSFCTRSASDRREDDGSCLPSEQCVLDEVPTVERAGVEGDPFVLGFDAVESSRARV